MNEDLYSSYSFLLDRTARKVKQYAAQQFKVQGFNVTVDQWIVMKHLYERGPMKQSELAELAGKDHPTLTRIVDLLCRKSYTAREVHPEDRRSFMVSLTKEGQKKVKDLSPKIKKIRLKAWEGLSEGDFKKFSSVLNTIYRNLS